MTQISKTVFALLFVLLTVAAFFHKSLFFGLIPVPSDSLVGLYHPWRDYFADTYPRGVPFRNFLITDPVRQQIPWRKIAIEQLKKAQLPHWNPHNAMGTPLSANSQAGVWYPVNILFFVFNFQTAWTILIVLQVFMASLFQFMFLTHLRLDARASALGAIAWGLCGFSIAWLTWGTIVHVALWLPVTLLLIDKLLASVKKESYIRVFGWSFLAVCSIIMQILAGHIQIALYCMAFALCFGIYQALRLQKNNSLAYLLFPGLFVTALVATAFQWLPMLAFIRTSDRVLDVGAWATPGWFIPWKHLVQFLIPDFFGNPATLNYWGEWNYGEFIGYIGVIPLLFAISAIVRKKNNVTFFFFFAVIVGIILATPNVISKLPFILQILGISSLQPTRYMVIIDFSLTVLAAIGFDAFIKSKQIRLEAGVAGVLLLLLILGRLAIYLAGGINDAALKLNLTVSGRNMMLPLLLITISLATLGILRMFKQVKLFVIILFLLITSFDLLRFGLKFTPFTERKYFFPVTKSIEFLKNQAPPFRVATLDDRIFAPNTLAYYGIESIDLYDPMYSHYYGNFMKFIETGKTVNAPEFQRIVSIHTYRKEYFRIMNVKYIIGMQPVSDVGLKEVFREGETIIYELEETYPRVYFADQIVTAKKGEEMLTSLNEYINVSDKIAVVDSDTVTVSNTPIAPEENVIITSYDANRIEIQTNANETRYLVIANNFYRTWRATVDDAHVPVLRTNYLFMGIAVPAGAHSIVLYHTI